MSHSITWSYSTSDGNFVSYTPYFSKRLERAYDIYTKQRCQLTDPFGVRVEIDFTSMKLSLVGGSKELTTDIRRFESLRWQRAHMLDSPNFDWIDYDEQQAQLLEKTYQTDKDGKVILEARVRRKTNRLSSGSTQQSGSSSSGSIAPMQSMFSSTESNESDIYEIRRFEVSLSEMTQTSLHSKTSQTVRRVMIPQWKRKSKDDQWIPFFQENSDEIERSYCIAMQGRTSIAEGGKLYTFNIASNPMVQEAGIVTGPERVIRRDVKSTQQIKLKITNSSTMETRLVVVPLSETFPSLLFRLMQMYSSETTAKTVEEFRDSIQFSYIDNNDTISVKDQFDFDSLMKLGKDEVTCQISFNLLQLPVNESSSSGEPTPFSSGGQTTSSTNLLPIDLNEILTGSGDSSFGDNVPPEEQAPVLQPKKASPQSRSPKSTENPTPFQYESRTPTNETQIEAKNEDSSSFSFFLRKSAVPTVISGPSPQELILEQFSHNNLKQSDRVAMQNIKPDMIAPFIPQTSTVDRLSSPPNSAQGNFKLMELLGKGSYGRVYKVRKQDTGQIAAVKQIPLPKDPKQILSIEQEISLMEKLHHDCIVQYSGTERNEKYIYIFMEYCSEGSLQQMLDKEGVFPESLIKAYTKHILEGLGYLHEHKIVHRDLKCGNILVDHMGRLKLADFGCSKIIRELEENQMHSFKGTIHFMAPEVVDHAYYSEKSDIWALGIMIIQMITGKPPFINYGDRMQLMNCIRNLKQPPPLPSNISPELEEFLSYCLAINPEDRKSCKELLQTRFIINSVDTSSKNSDSFVQDQLTSVYETYEESTIPFSTGGGTVTSQQSL